jgi:hypothetical protein
VPPPLTPIAGLFLDPRASEVTERITLPQLPPPTFESASAGALDQTLLFDAATGSVANLGAGFRGWFSPDGTRMAWVGITADPVGELRVIDLETRTERAIGPGVDTAPWADDETVVTINRTGTTRLGINVDTGAITVAPPFNPPGEPFTAQVRGELKLLPISDGSPATFELRQLASREMLLRFEAEAAAFAGERELVIATPAVGTDQTSNLFLVDVDQATATFVASTRITVRSLIAVSATEQQVAWTDAFCSANATLRAFDRVTSEIREYAGADWAVLTPNDDLAIGEFGARALFDLETGAYTTVLPSTQLEVNWSHDYRYASVGAELEHGSRCP